VQSRFDFPPGEPQVLGDRIVLLGGFAPEAALRAGIEAVAALAPFRHWAVPGGKRMSVAMTNCGTLGWTSDERGYRYSALDPNTGVPWPAMPAVFAQLAHEAAACAGFSNFVPDACLINRYSVGAAMGLHRDADERDAFSPTAQPIVSVSLGAPARFVIGGLARRDALRTLTLASGDVLVWGGAARLAYHGVRPLKAAPDAAADGVHGGERFNLTFRGAG
jgi:DNA oxidative demethylase